jgi:uncharacterized protein (TIRG00374 family)
MNPIQPPVAPREAHEVNGHAASWPDVPDAAETDANAAAHDASGEDAFPASGAGPGTTIGQRSGLRRFLSTSARLILTALLLGLVASQLELAALGERLAGMNWFWAAAALAMTFGERMAQATKWHLLLGSKSNTISWPVAMRVQLTATFFGGFLPSSLGVDTLRVIAVVRRGMKVVDAMAATLLDRAVMIASQLAVGGVMAMALSTQLPASVRWFIWIFAGVAALGGGLVLASPVARGLGKWMRPVIGKHLMEKVARFYEAVQSYREQPATLGLVGLTVLGVFMLRTLFGLMMVWAMDVDVTLPQLILVLPLLWVLATLPVTIGALGLQEGVYLLLFGILGVGATAAVSVSLLEHVLVRLASLPGAIFWAVGDRPEIEKQSAARVSTEGDGISG